MPKQRKRLVPEAVPVADECLYNTNEVSIPITIYDGDLELEQGTKRLVGKGVVYHEWFPQPGLRFDLDLSLENQDEPELDAGTLHLLGIGWHAKVAVLRLSASSSKGIFETKGIVEEFELGSSQHVCKILFSIVNFNDFNGIQIRDISRSRTWLGRSVVEAGEWRITIDKLEQYVRIYNGLKNTGGYAITHTGKLERLDGKKFAAKKTEDVFDALFRYLSFCRGAWVAPILPVGFDEGGARVWEKWRGWKIERWKNVPNWFDFIDSEEGLSKGFPGFYQRWQSEKWNEPLLLSNHWYVEANMASGGQEGAIILAQAAFELLGWTHLVEEKKALSDKGYSNLDAMDKMRLLLSLLGIPADIPSSLSKLSSVANAKDNQWKDGPQALTEIRNALVHANPAKRKKVFGEHHALVHEAWKLSLWYLEMVLLRTYGYMGKYLNRVVFAGWKSEAIQKVPWMDILP